MRALTDRERELREPTREERFAELLLRHRWATVVPLVLPLSKAYDVGWRLRNIHARRWLSRPERHEARVARIQAALKRWNDEGRPAPLCTSRKPWQSVAARGNEYKDESYPIDVELHDILAIDLDARRVRIEPRVNMGQLTRALVPLGYTIPVVPELDDLTAGGLFLGYGIESSSHRHGLFADTVVRAEVVVADGRVVRCSADENADLFRALPWSYGAHGFLTALTLPLVPCGTHIRLVYEPVFGLERIVRRFGELVSDPKGPEHVEGLLYDRDSAVLMHGDHSNGPIPAEPENAIGRWHKPWFYKHAESALAKGPFVEHIPLREWYHRHTRSLYWHGELLVPFGNHPAFRYALGWLMPPKVSFLKLTQTEAMMRARERRTVVQDALVPLRHLGEAVEMFHREFECYPLWLCAHRTPHHEPAGMVQPAPGTPVGDYEMYVDIGAWQVPAPVRRGQCWDGHQAVRNMEAWCRAHRSYQCLYAVTEQTREEFWEMFDPTLYRRVRAKYGSEGVFMDTYDKVRRPARS